MGVSEFWFQVWGPLYGGSQSSRNIGTCPKKSRILARDPICNPLQLLDMSRGNSQMFNESLVHVFALAGKYLWNPKDEDP